jgi:acyl-CoA synthetase (AMP-forming)/AMP-acid ligase II
VFTGYSCTETAIISATLASIRRSARRHSSAGRPGVDVCIVGDDRRPLPGERAGPHRSEVAGDDARLLAAPEETARALTTRAGCTEDMGFLDDHGYLHLIGARRWPAPPSTYPGEVEDAPDAPQGRAGGGVLGVPDDVLGQKGGRSSPTDAAAPPTLDELRD